MHVNDKKKIKIKMWVKKILYISIILCISISISLEECHLSFSPTKFLFNYNYKILQNNIWMNNSL